MMEITDTLDAQKQQLDQAMERWESLSLEIGE